MKHLFALCLLFLGLLPQAISQGLLTPQEFVPSVGERFVLHTIDYIDPGKEVIWDLSDVTIRSSNAMEVIHPSSSPFAGLFSDSDICYDHGNGDYMYYIADQERYASTGGVARGDVLLHAEPKDILQFPLESSTNFKDEYSATFSVKGVEFHRLAEVEIQVMGEGTAIFPFGIMDEVIKIRMIEKIEDHYEVLGEAAVIKSNKESYYFIKPGIHEFIMSLHISTQNGNVVKRYGTLLDTEELQDMLAMYAPIRAIHPSEDINNGLLNVKLISEWTGQLHISLMDLKGQEVAESVTLDALPGKLNASLNIAELAAGTYIMNFAMDDRLSQVKVVKD